MSATWNIFPVSASKTHPSDKQCKSKAYLGCGGKAPDTSQSTRFTTEDLQF